MALRLFARVQGIDTSIRERVNAGLRAAKARGVRLGRPATNGIHNEAVRCLLAEGKRIRAIARDLV